jgi:hypothetical protein
MPLTSKGNKIMGNMEKEYGSKEAKKVFYASKNAGKISGVDAALDGLIAGAAALKGRVDALMAADMAVQIEYKGQVIDKRAEGHYYVGSRVFKTEALAKEYIDGEARSDAKVTKGMLQAATSNLDMIRELCTESGNWDGNATQYHAPQASRNMETIVAGGGTLPDWAVRNKRFLEVQRWKFPWVRGDAIDNKKAAYDLGQAMHRDAKTEEAAHHYATNSGKAMGYNVQEIMRGYRDARKEAQKTGEYGRTAVKHGLPGTRKYVDDAEVAPTLTGVTKFVEKMKHNIKYLREQLNGATTPDEREALKRDIRTCEEAIIDAEVEARGDGVLDILQTMIEAATAHDRHDAGDDLNKIPRAIRTRFQTAARKAQAFEDAIRAGEKSRRDPAVKRELEMLRAKAEDAGREFMKASMSGGLAGTYKGDAEIKLPERIPVPAMEGRVLKTGDKYEKDGKKGRIIAMRGLPDESYILSVRWDSVRVDAREYPFHILINGSDAGGGGGYFKTLAEAKAALPKVRRELEKNQRGVDVPSLQIINADENDKIVWRGDESSSKVLGDIPWLKNQHRRGDAEFRRGQKVTVINGPFKGATGTVEEPASTYGGGYWVKLNAPHRQTPDIPAKDLRADALEYEPLKGRALVAARKDSDLLMVRDRLDRLASGVHRTIRRADALTRKDVDVRIEPKTPSLGIDAAWDCPSCKGAGCQDCNGTGKTTRKDAEPDEVEKARLAWEEAKKTHGEFSSRTSTAHRKYRKLRDEGNSRSDSTRGNMRFSELSAVGLAMQIKAGNPLAIKELNRRALPQTRHDAVRTPPTSKEMDSNALRMLSLGEIKKALNNSGYGDLGDIKRSRFSGFNKDGSEAVYKITFMDDNGEEDEGNVFISRKGGQFVGEF